MANPVGDGARRDLVPEDLRPTGYPDVGRDHGRPLLVAGAHKLEKQVGAALVDVEVAQLVDYEELRGGVALESLLEYTARLGASPSPAARSASRRPRAFRAMLGGDAAELLAVYGVEDVALGDLGLMPGLKERARAEKAMPRWPSLEGKTE